MITPHSAVAGSAGLGESPTALGQIPAKTPVRLVEHCLLETREILHDVEDFEGVQRWEGLLQEFVKNCDEYLEARKEESGFLLRFGLICAQGCDSVASICRELGHPDAGQLERFCRVCEKFLEREFRTSLENRASGMEISADLAIGKAS